MTPSTHFHQGNLTISQTLLPKQFAVVEGTSLTDSARQLAESTSPYCFVVSKQSQPAGLVRRLDLQRCLSQASPDADSRPIESLISIRFDPSESAIGSHRQTELHDGSQVTCVPLLEDGRLVGVMTGDDVLLSTERIQSLLQAATTDEVTDLANRATFNRRLHEEWKRSQQNHDPFALVMFDVDYFKQVNDQYGHLVGDHVLSAVARQLKLTLRSYDIVARFGGDEFAALCCNCDVEGTDTAIHRLQKALCQLRIPGAPDSHRPTLSIGAVVVASGFDSLSISQIVETADTCLYRAKDAGRDCAFRVVLDGEHSFVPVRIPELGIAGLDLPVKSSGRRAVDRVVPALAVCESSPCV